MSTPTPKPPDLHALIEGLAAKIDGLAEAAASDSAVRAQINDLRRDVDRLIEAEARASENAKARRRLAVAGAAALASLAGGTSEHWMPVIRAVLAALGV